MTDKAPQAGCVVQVVIAGLPSEEGSQIARSVLGPPSFQYFNVAIAAPDKAVEATMKHLAKTATKDGEVSVVRGLSSGEIATLSLKAGEVKPA